jgi:hypothetical protein
MVIDLFFFILFFFAVLRSKHFITELIPLALLLMFMIIFPFLKASLLNNYSKLYNHIYLIICSADNREPVKKQKLLSSGGTEVNQVNRNYCLYGIYIIVGGERYKI